MTIYENFFNSLFNESILFNSTLKENKDDFTIELLVPGFDKSDFEIKIENNILLIIPKNNAKDKKSYQLSNQLDTDNIQATCNKGILLIKIPKKERIKNSKVIEIL